MISPSTLTAAGGARIPDPAEAAAYARRPLACLATGYSLSYPQRRVLSLATSDPTGFPVWAIASLEGMPRVEVLAHARALQACGLVDLGRVDGKVQVLPRSAGCRVKNSLNSIKGWVGNGV